MATADAVSPVVFFAFPFLWLQIMLFIQQSIVGFDEFMKVQAGRAWHADVFVVIRIVFNLQNFGFDLRFGIIQLHIRGAIKKFSNSVWCTNDTGKTTTSFFNTISLHISTMTLVKKVPQSSEIEFLRHAVEIRLRGPLDLIIAAKPLSTKMLHQMSKQIQVAGWHVCWIRWMRQLFNSDVLDYTARVTWGMCAGALSCSSSGHRVSIPLRFSLTAWRSFFSSSL